MPDTIIESVLTQNLDTVLLLKWLNNESIEEAPDDCILFCCNKNEFVAHFLSYIRTQTDSILQSNSNALHLLQKQATPEKIPSRRKHHRSVSDPTSDTDRTVDTLSAKAEHSSHESPNRDRKKTGRKVKTKLFQDDRSKDPPISPDDSKLSTGVNRLVISSTPVKNGYRNEYPSLHASPVTPTFRSLRDSYERCDTPRISHRHSRSQEKNLSLGDFLVNAQPKSSKKKRGKNTSDDNDVETKVDLDLSNSEMFPEIGARKSSSLRSERRRIKPTNLDKSANQKSFSLSSFHTESFQQQSPLALEENVAFKHQRIQPKESSNSYETERNILKQERHKLMEKFNILNTSTSPKLDSTPQIKVTRQKTTELKQTYIAADINRVTFKEQIEVLVEIYDAMLKNNLILSLNTELYFLISILLSEQYEDDSKVDSRMEENKISDGLLKSIHNSTYFAVKSLWCERTILEVILDKNSLKILGENKRVRSFYPDLAKFLLNAYGLKVEAEINHDKSKLAPEATGSNGVICFNLETDNADNFPSVLSFQNFKKQRDMFYEILRWYQDTQTTGGSRTSFKARIKTLISSGPTAANHAHLAALFTAHMLAECLPSNGQESKLSKLHRRLTCPNAPESHRLPHFTDKEMFYKEFITYAENECFRVHLRDALASEIVALDSASIATESSNGSDISREFLQLSKKLCLLSKFLGYLTSLPYSQVPTDFVSKAAAALGSTRVQKEMTYAVPKEKVLESNIALRNYSQPCIDLRGILASSEECGRLCITVPWLVHYLSMLDYATLRLRYYQHLLRMLFGVYSTRLKLSPLSLLKRNTVIYLKSSLGWLFDLPHFPREFLRDAAPSCPVVGDSTVDYHELLDEASLLELCPFLRDVNALLLTCRPPQERREAGSFRHITPVSLGGSDERVRNKERELQARLEEEFLKTQPSSTRRVLELVMERVTSGAVKELAAQMLCDFRKRTRERASQLVIANNAEDNDTLLKAVEGLYSKQLQRLRTEALEAGTASIRRRAGAALAALLPAAPPPLLALAVKGCVNRLNKWLNDNWNTTAVLCKDIEEEMKTLIALGEAATVNPQSPVDLAAMMLPDDKFEAVHVSAAAAVINLKEHICLLLEGETVGDASELLARCAAACSPSNLFGRPPTQRAILQLSVDYCIVFVSRMPEQVDDAFLGRLHAVWAVCCPERRRGAPAEVLLPERRAGLSPRPRPYDDERAPTPASDEEPCSPPGAFAAVDPTTVVVVVDGAPAFDANVSTEQKNEGQDDRSPLLEFFERILCPRNVVLLSESKCRASVVWEALATVLVFLLRNDYLTEDSLTEQCLAVYRQDWPQNILESLSTCMKSVSSRWARSSTGKFTLFLDFLAEYCGDMDYEPLD